MDFNEWLLNEVSLNELYTSTVNAFPMTRKRQHATDLLEVKIVRFTPFVGMKTLMIKSVVQSENREYNCIMLFKDIRYHGNIRDVFGLVEIFDQTGTRYLIERISSDQNNLLVRCNCSDFHWRGTHFNKEHGCLFGRDRTPYESLYNPGSANPTESPIMCKHLIAMAKSLHNLLD